MTTIKSKVIGTLMISILLTCFSFYSRKMYRPKYHSKKTQEIIEKMILAHGGMEAWILAPTISYTHTYTNPFDPSDLWTSEEIIEQGRRRVYQYWPLDSAEIIFDGNDFYSVGWKRGNPPKFTAHLAYYFGNIPWLTQDESVLLGEVRKRKILNDPKEYIAIKMTFRGDAGEAPKDYYDLLIDPETYLVRGYEYIVTYGALLDAMELPKEVEFMGPFFKLIDSYETVNGLTVPKRLTTFGMDGEDYGTHAYKDWSITKSFSEDLMQLPIDAIKDDSSNLRK